MALPSFLYCGAHTPPWPKRILDSDDLPHRRRYWYLTMTYKTLASFIVFIGYHQAFCSSPFLPIVRGFCKPETGSPKLGVRPNTGSPKLGIAPLTGSPKLGVPPLTGSPKLGVIPLTGSPKPEDKT